METASPLIAIDTGGTFTDAVRVCPDGTLRRVKVPSRPDDPSAAIEAALRALDVPLDTRFELRHGTTVGTNALLEGKVGRALFLTNAGFEDVPWLARQARPSLHALHPTAAPPPVRRADVVGVPLRVGADGAPLETLTETELAAWLDTTMSAFPDVDAVAVCLLHAHRHPADERRLAAHLRARWPSLRLTVSHTLAPVEREYERGMTCLVNAALGATVGHYLDRLAERLPYAGLHLMASAGALMPAGRAAREPVHTVLSGPAGGVLGALEVGRRCGREHLLTLDVGGTSTDVCVVSGQVLPRNDGHFGEWPLRVPLLPVETVGAGGGSLATLDDAGALSVGPHSAGAVPGPACYDRGGTAPTVTDANVVLGRLGRLLGGALPLAAARATEAIRPIAASLGASVEDTALAIVRTAEAAIARACRRVSLERGHDPRTLTIVAFGGAGGLHACAVADELGCAEVLFPEEPGLLSADGMLAAPWGLTRSRSLGETLDAFDAFDTLEARVRALRAEAEAALDLEVPAETARTSRAYAELRYVGQTHTLPLELEGLDLTPASVRRAFEAAHMRAFGLAFEASRGVELVALHVEARAQAASRPTVAPTTWAGPTRLCGPARLATYGATLWLPPGWAAERQPTGDWLCRRDDAPTTPAEVDPLGPLALGVHAQRMAAIAEEMGAVLKRAAFSANIKERQDYSCAVFDARGRMLVHAAHIPVHLGSTPASVHAALEAFEPRGLRPGEQVLLNDPFQGGTHLPDVTLVTPVFGDTDERPAFYLANRAHHADVGGRSAGSLPVPRHLDGRVESVTLADEGLCFGPTLLDDTLRRRFADASRTPDERHGDLRAQEAANHAGAAAMASLLRREGREALERLNDALLDHAERRCRALLRALPDVEVRVSDALDDDGLGDTPIPLSVRLSIVGDTALLDLTDAPDQTPGPMNAVRSIVVSAVVYTLACLAGDDLPANAGLLRPIELRTRPGSVVDAVAPAAVSAGNVETSQRLVDLFLAAFGAAGLPVPAASQGTMNNVLFGGHTADGRPFVHYETLGGGGGARPGEPGLSGRHVHMTNTLNTPVESLERAYPVRIRTYALRPPVVLPPGVTPGGRGVVRTYEFLVPTEVTVLGERRRLPPPSLGDAPPGERGRETLVNADGERIPLPSKVTFTAQPGDRLVVETPGGGHA